MREKIWRDPNKQEETMDMAECESGRRDISGEFIRVISDEFVKALRLPWAAREPLRNVLISYLEADVKKLLEQYLHHELEIIGKEMNQRLKIDEQICPNYATHAKLSDHMTAIKNLFKEKDQMIQDLVDFKNSYQQSALAGKGGKSRVKL